MLATARAVRNSALLSWSVSCSEFPTASAVLRAGVQGTDRPGAKGLDELVVDLGAEHAFCDGKAALVAVVLVG
jgi:hypothetical protein